MRTHLKTAVSILSLSLVLTAAVPVTALAASRKAPRPVPTQQDRARGRDGEVIPGPIQRIIRVLKNVLILEDPPAVTVDDQPTNPHP
jgi:hypothetical protein